MIYPAADTIEEMVGSRYSLVILAAKRAKQIKEGAPVLIDTASTNPLTIALEEIAAGKVTVNPAGIAPRPESETSSETPSFTALVDGDGVRMDLGDEDDMEQPLLSDSADLDTDEDDEEE